MSDTMSDETALSILDKLHKANARLLSPSERLALNHIAARLAQQPAAAVPDMAAFCEVRDCFLQMRHWLAGERPRINETDAKQYVAAWDAYTQALASRVQVPEVTMDDVQVANDVFDDVHDGMANIRAALRAVLKRDRARVRASAEQGNKR